jgi:hypothetical protein
MFTNVGSLTGVSSLVISEVSLGCEVHVTVCEVALEGFLTIVDPHMRE